MPHYIDPQNRIHYIDAAHAGMLPAGSVELPPRPGPTHIWSGGAWVADDVATANAERVAADASAATYAKQNAVITYLATHTPAEVEAKVQADVTDLASAKAMLKHFAVALCVLARREFRP